MAERTVNINIRYNINTAEVQKVVAASQAAQKATEELRKSVEAYGKSSAQAHRAVADSTQSVAKQFNDLYSTVKLVLTAGIAREIVDVSLNMAKLAGQVDAVARAFRNQIPNSTSLLNNLRTATHGTVTDLELMQKTLQAFNFGIDVQELPKLLEFAAVRAQQTGVSVDYLVNSIVTGIGRKSILILDNLGISATRLKEEFNGASLASQSLASVTQAVSRIAGEELQKMGDFAENSATDVDQLSVSWSRLRENIAKFFSSGAIPKFLKEYVDSFSALAEAINRGISVSDVFQERTRQQQAQITASEFATRRLIGTREENAKALEEEIERLTHSLGLYAEERDKAQAVIDFLNEQILARTANAYVMREGIRIQKDLIAEKKEDALLDQEILRILREKLNAINAENQAEVESLGIVAAKRKEIELLQQQIEETQKMGDLGASGKLTTSLKKAQQELDALLGKTKDKTKKDGNEVAEYLAYLSDLELEEMKKVLTDRAAATERQKENDKRSYEHWKYYEDLKKQKLVEAQEEEYILREEAAERRRQLEEDVNNAIFGTIYDQFNSLLTAEVDMYSERIYHLRNFYDEQILLAGDNERAKKELKLKEERELQQLEKIRADREKKAAQAGILVNTALAIIKIFAGEGTYIDKIIRSGIMAAEGASQYAVVSRARYYARGEINIKGPGTETSDSIPAMLSKGESVMTAKQTREAFGILTDIRSGKLNDKVLRQMVNNGGSQAFDDSRIIDAIKSQPKPPDLVSQGRQIYEVYKGRDGSKRFIRSKSI